LQKLLASAGVASRRKAEVLLREGRVTVNGHVASLGQSADPSRDTIEVDGERLARRRPCYWVVYKPRGLVTTRHDPEGRATVMSLLPESLRSLVSPVGRLDRQTEGLVLLTNDGDLAHVLLHPSLGSEREYRVTVEGRLEPDAIRRLSRGFYLEGRRTAAADVEAVNFDSRTKRTRFRLTLREGRKRQIRRSLEALGHPVIRLVRVRFGPLRVDSLSVGEARALTTAERVALRRYVARLRTASGARSRGPKGAGRQRLSGS
jgi:23S rRNA pseudouridine2605 synthase